jgi:hypothetical protein
VIEEDPIVLLVSCPPYNDLALVIKLHRHKTSN